MMYKRISDLMDGLDFDIETLPLSDVFAPDPEEIKKRVTNRICDAEGGRKCEDQNI